MNKEKYKEIEEKLSLLKYKPDDFSHIEIDGSYCKNCKNKECTFFCPANVYKLEDEKTGKIKIEYENCLECGACKVGCPFKAIKWNYPRGGKGIVYKFG